MRKNLSFEYSRGCEWEHRTPGRLRGCTFCGLYRNSQGHHRKPIERVLRAVEEAVQKYRVLNLAFVDAYLPPDYRDELLDGLNRLPADITYFTELRCDLTRSTVERLSVRAGRVQLGVESFSTAILRRIGKGVGLAKSIYSIRLCQENGIAAQYNLMMKIPGVPRSEIEELHDLLPKLFGLGPPTPTEFYLDRNSLVFADPQAHGVAPETLDQERPLWLARALGDSRISQVVPFAFEDREAAAVWDRVKKQIAQWEERWQSARSAGFPSPLFWRDGIGWASIVDARANPAQIYLLEGVLYDVFIGCNDVTTEQRLRATLPSYGAELIAEALRELAAGGLVLQDGPLWVSLPVRERARMDGTIDRSASGA